MITFQIKCWSETLVIYTIFLLGQAAMTKEEDLLMWIKSLVIHVHVS